MRDDVHDFAMVDQLERLALAFGKPYGVRIGKQAAEWAAGFRRAGVPLCALRAAVDEIVLEGGKFPTLGDLLRRARPHTPKTDGERQQSLELCPQCQQAYAWRPTDTVGGIELLCPCQYPVRLRYAKDSWLQDRADDPSVREEIERRRRQNTLRASADAH